MDRHRFAVTISPRDLAALSPSEQTEILQRAATVQREARERLEQMTGEFDLTAGQRAKMFPIMVRSSPGYDPVMRVADSDRDGPRPVPVDEEVHKLLDPDQQKLLEDREIDRQLWWQDIFSRIEADLVKSTGGLPTGTPDTGDGEITDDPAAPDAPRPAPAPRGAVER